MADRRTSERLLVAEESIDRLTPPPPAPFVGGKVGAGLIGPPESPDRASTPGKLRRETEDRTEPMRLSFLALLAERDPAVQTRLNRRITPVLALEEPPGKDAREDEDRPTDPMILAATFRG